MNIGIVYVVHNDWIKDPVTGQMPYKIGITKRTIKKRYYGLGLKMPGKFICDFAYEFGENYSNVENTLHNMLNQLNVNGEWFIINKDALEGIQNICKLAGGNLITTKIENEILLEIKKIKNERNKPVFEKFNEINEKWNSISNIKITGKAKKKKVIRIPEINNSVYFLFRLRNKNEISIELGCFTKKYPNFDILLNSYNGIKINGLLFNYPELSKREKDLGYKGKLRTFIPLNEIDLAVNTMNALINETKNSVINACIG
ncbi:MAG: GIY-YIG nuclease family protein [Treponema sp.]|nr:GIY-YIG nuclease family protein [Treponema sp.]